MGDLHVKVFPLINVEKTFPETDNDLNVAHFHAVFFFLSVSISVCSFCVVCYICWPTSICRNLSSHPPPYLFIYLFYRMRQPQSFISSWLFCFLSARSTFFFHLVTTSSLLFSSLDECFFVLSVYTPSYRAVSPPHPLTHHTIYSQPSTHRPTFSPLLRPPSPHTDWLSRLGSFLWTGL